MHLSVSLPFMTWFNSFLNGFLKKWLRSFNSMGTFIMCLKMLAWFNSFLNFVLKNKMVVFRKGIIGIMGSWDNVAENIKYLNKA